MTVTKTTTENNVTTDIKITENVNEETVTKMNKDELKMRLKKKIKSKMDNRTSGLSKKKTVQMNDSLKKISNILEENKIETIDQIDSKLLEILKSNFQLKDLELILNKITEQSNFKDMLCKIKDKMKETS
tara:strand:- start:800 stop:1189 length:390 start_codon:yes stop_codon:yes gene_type:complete